MFGGGPTESPWFGDCISFHPLRLAKFRGIIHCTQLIVCWKPCSRVPVTVMPQMVHGTTQLSIESMRKTRWEKTAVREEMMSLFWFVGWNLAWKAIAEKMLSSRGFKRLWTWNLHQSSCPNLRPPHQEFYSIPLMDWLTDKYKAPEKTWKHCDATWCYCTIWDTKSKKRNCGW